MNRFFPWIVTLFLNMPLLAGHVSVQMPRSQGYVGIEMQLIVVFENTVPDVDPSIPDISGFTIRKLPNVQTSSHTTIINGRMTSTSSQAITFLLTPERIGTYMIPALIFHADGKTFQSLPKEIEIHEPPTGGALRAEVVGTDGDVYLGQPIDVTLNIFIEQFTDDELGDSLDARDMFSRIRNNSEFGIFKDEITSGRAKGQVINGLNDAGAPITFFVFSLRATTWPETTGQFELTPINILVDYPISLEQTRGFGFFSRDTLRVDQSQLISAQASMPSINVLTPPKEEQPAWYSGAIGTFDFRMVAEPTYVNVGEPITITMRISDLTAGSVNLDYLFAPYLGQVPTLTKDFRVPDEILGGRAEGRTKTFTQSIRPKHDKVKEIPPIPFTSFNPSSNSYETRWTKAIPITVNPTATISAKDILGSSLMKDSSSKKQSFTEVDGGILANYSGDSLLEDQRVQTTPMLIAAISAPPVIFLSIACSLLYRKRNQTTAVKKHHAIRHVAKTLQTTQDADSISKLFRELQRSFEFEEQDTQGLESIIQRCDLKQYGGKQDQQLAQDASSLMEVLR